MRGAHLIINIVSLLGRGATGHDTPITDIAFDASGTYVATASTDRTVRVWHVAGGYCTHALRSGHAVIVRRVWFHPLRGRLLVVSADDEGGLCMWTLHAPTAASGPAAGKGRGGPAEVTCHKLVNHMSAVTGVAFIADGARLVSVSRDKVINTWDLATASLVHTLPVYECMEAVVAWPTQMPLPAGSSSAADAHVLTVGDKGILRLWNMTSHKCVHQHQPHGTSSLFHTICFLDSH